MASSRLWTMIKLFALVPALVVVVVARLLRPVVLIRFARLPTSRIGRAANTELYLCERELGPQGKRTVDFFYPESVVCNSQMMRMWERNLHVSSWAGLADKVSRRLPGARRHVVPMPSDRDVQALFSRTGVHLVLTRDEELRGRRALREMGIPDGTPYVCFVARDSAYLEATVPPPEGEGSWRYHDYRDTDIRNYVPMAQALVRRGYFAIRMGAIVKEPLPASDPKIIDYATNGSRTDFLDIYLGASCHFFVSTGTGIDAIPMLHRIPVAYVNFGHLEFARSWNPKDLFIPKKLWLREEGRFMTFRETLESGAGRFVRSDQYQQLGIEPVENTPEEITALVVEMDERLKGAWQDTREDEEMQRHFWTLFKGSNLHGELVSRIGAQFLRENRELLE